MAPRNEMQAGKNNSWKRIKKVEKKMKRMKAALANQKAETNNTLTGLKELHLTITQIREVIRPLLLAGAQDAQLAVAFLAQNNGD